MSEYNDNGICKESREAIDIRNKMLSMFEVLYKEIDTNGELIHDIYNRVEPFLANPIPEECGVCEKEAVSEYSSNSVWNQIEIAIQIVKNQRETLKQFHKRTEV